MKLRVARAVVAAAAAAFFLAPAEAAAQSNSEEIIVTGERVQELAQAYAGAVAVAPSSVDQYARWNFRLCPSVAGLAAADAQTLIDHLARRAHDVGIEAERTGCQPNLVIIFAPDSDQIARNIIDNRRDLLGYYTEDDVITAGRDALEAFANTHRPVRWWHVSRTTTADGQQLGDSRSRVGRGTRDAVAAQQSDNASNGAATLSGSGFSGVEAVRSQGTRTRRATRQDISFVLVIVDTRDTAGIPAQAVADYLSMATLVQLNPGADLSAFPSILNLFRPRPDGAAPMTGLTDWDVAYLHGLYGMTREAANTRQQQSEIARSMAAEVTPQ